MTAYEIAAALHTQRREGTTVDRDGVHNPHKMGYYVGGLFPSLVFEDIEDFDRGEVAWWIGTHPAKYYGVWTDADTGKVYVDAVQWAVTRGAALSLGRDRGELAVWDIRKGEEIRTDSDENSQT